MISHGGFICETMTCCILSTNLTDEMLSIFHLSLRKGSAEGAQAHNKIPLLISSVSNTDTNYMVSIKTNGQL